MKTWNIESITGYKPKTTFYEDFSIADAFGVNAIKDTYNRAVKSWSTDVEYYTELVMVLNWKIWEHYEKNPAYGRLYNTLWEEADEKAFKLFEGEELNYFLSTID